MAPDSVAPATEDQIARRLDRGQIWSCRWSCRKYMFADALCDLFRSSRTIGLAVASRWASQMVVPSTGKVVLKVANLAATSLL
jgi:hypothetical protein